MSDPPGPLPVRCEIGTELHEWNVKGSERVDEGGCIPLDPKYFFKINCYVKPNANEPVGVREDERNSISIGMTPWHKARVASVEEGIARWGERSDMVVSFSAPGVPAKTNGGYSQYKITELPNTLYIELSRHDPWTDAISTDGLSCPATLDFAKSPLLAGVLEKGAVPCKYRLEGVQVGELRKETPDDSYITWWGYVWNEADAVWRSLTDKTPVLYPVDLVEVTKHLDAGGNVGKTFPLRLYYRRVIEVALPPMPLSLVDFEAPRTCIKVPCSGPWERIPWGPDEEPWGDASTEHVTLCDEIIRHPVYGAYGVFYVHLHVVVSYPDDPEPAFNRNVGNRGDMYIVACFDTEFPSGEPEDAILDVDREPWPEEPDGTPIPADDPRIPEWAKGWHDMNSYGMPIPERYFRPMAVQMAHLKHARWNMLRERLAEAYRSLHENIHDMIKNRDHAASVMKAVNKAIAETQHPHMGSLDKAALLGYSGNDIHAERKLPMPRTVQALSYVMHVTLDTADFEANKYGFACGVRPDKSWFADYLEYEFDSPDDALCCTVDHMVHELWILHGHLDAFPWMGCLGMRPYMHLGGIAADAPRVCPRAENAARVADPEPLTRGVGPKVAAARVAKITPGHSKKTSKVAMDAARAAAAMGVGVEETEAEAEEWSRMANRCVADAKWAEKVLSVESNDFDDFTKRVEKQLWGDGRPRGTARDQTRRDFEWMKQSEAEKARKEKKAEAEALRAREANSSMRRRHQAPSLYTERLNKKRAEELREEQQRKQEEREQAKAAAEAAAKAALKEKIAREKGEAEAAALGKAQEAERKAAEEEAAKKATAAARELAKEERKAARRLNRKKTPAQLQAEADAAAEAKHEAEMAEMVARVQKTLGITLDPAELS